MNNQIENLIYYIKETFNDANIELTENGFIFIFDALGVETDTKIAVNQDNFTLINKDRTINIQFIGQSLKEKYKQLTDYIIFIKQVIISSIESNFKSTEVDENNILNLEE